jgi:hypothetical protein
VIIHHYQILNRYTKQGRRIQVLRNRDKMKDDAIAQLSDQVMDAIALLIFHTYIHICIYTYRDGEAYLAKQHI